MQSAHTPVTSLGTKASLKRWLNLVAPEGGMVHGAVMLGGATLVTQALAILLSPVFARLYSPEDYGIFGLYSAILATALTVGSFCYETGIPLSENNSDGVGLTAIAIVLVIVIGVGTMLWLALRMSLGYDASQLQLGRYMWLLPLGIVGAGVYRAIRFWALRCNAMSAISRTSAAQAVSSSMLMFGFGVFHPTPLGLMLGGIAGSSVGMWGLARRTQLIPRMREARQSGLTVGGLWTLAKKYRRLPLISAPSTLFNSLGLYLPGVLLIPYFGAAFAGQFFMGMKVMSLPTSVIGGAVSQVFFSRAATVARERPNELSRLFQDVFRRAATLSLLILLVGLAAPWVVPLALGRRWAVAGEICAWLSIISAFGVSVSALSFIPSIVGRLEGQFAIDVARAAAVLLLLVLGHRFGVSGMGMVKGYVLVMVVNYMACYHLYRHQVSVVSLTGRTGWSASE